MLYITINCNQQKIRYVCLNENEKNNFQGRFQTIYVSFLIQNKTIGLIMNHHNHKLAVVQINITIKLQYFL